MQNGEYVTFVDSDDILFPNAIENMYKEMIDNNADLVVCGWIDFQNDEIVFKCKKAVRKLVGNETMKFFLNEKYFTSVIWGKLYRTKVINKNRFDESIVIAEDFDFLYRVLKNVKVTIVNTDIFVYQYRVRETSAMRKKYSNTFEYEIELTEKVLEDIKESDPMLLKDAIRRYQRINVSCIDKYFKENGNIEGVMHLKENLKKYKINLKLKDYIKIILLLYNRPLLKVIYKKMKIM